MTSLTLSFNDVNFSPVQQNGQIWLTATELAKALGYAKSDAVTQIYERNKDEFTSDMTFTLNMSVKGFGSGNSEKATRIFNSRGCHLIAMLARTSIAKQFRKWVLDVLDKEVGQPVAKTHKSERTALHEAHALLVTKTKHLNSSQAWKLIHQRFNVKHIDEIPYDEIPVAVEYVHHLIALYSQTEKQGSLFDKDDYELIRQMTEAILAQNGAMDNVWKALELIDPLFINNYASYILKSNSLARKVSADFDFRTNRGQPLVDSFCRTINLSSGHRIGVNPKWFNAPAW